MKEILRTNDLVTISYAQALLSEQGIESVVLDAHAGTIYGGALIVRRVMVVNEDAERAMELVADLRD